VVVKYVPYENFPFEDDIWCMFYNLGYRHLNMDEFLRLPFDKEPENTKQIDIVAVCPTNKKSGCPYCAGKKTLNYDLFK